MNINAQTTQNKVENPYFLPPLIIEGSSFNPLKLLPVLIVFLLLISSCSKTIVIRIANPNQHIYTTKTVNFTLELIGFQAKTIKLFANNVLLSELKHPYHYAWDTSKVTEGRYEVVARVQSQNRVFESNTQTVTIDHTAPTIKSRSPIPNSENVQTNTPIQITFSEPIDPASLSNNNVLLSSSGSINLAKRLELSSDGTTLKILPLGSLDIPNKITLELQNTITDLAGNPLTIPTDAWTWDIPYWLDMNFGLFSGTLNEQHTAPSIILDGDKPIVVWEQAEDPGYYRVYASHWTGSSWERLGNQPLPFEAGTNSYEPKVILDNGDPIVAWSEVKGAIWENSPSKIRVARWIGNVWQPLGEPLSIYPEGSAREPDIALDNTGIPIVAWRESGQIHIYRWQQETWQSIGSLGDGVTDGPNLSSKYDNVALVSWAEIGKIQFAIWNGENAWSLSYFDSPPCGGIPFTAPAISTHEFDLGSVWITVHDTGKSLCVYSNTGGYNLIDNSLYGNIANPSIAINEYSSILAYSELGNSDNKQRMYVTQWDPINGKWKQLGDALPYETNVTNWAYNPSVILENETLVIAWQDQDHNIHVMKYNGNFH